MREPEAMFYDPTKALLIEVGVSRRLRARHHAERAIDRVCCWLVAHRCWPLAVVAWKVFGLW